MGIRQCYIFHDIDLLPMNAQNLYACSRLPLHLSSFIDTMRYNLPYASLFGGAVAVMQDMFEAVNGFSNEYSGKNLDLEDLEIVKVTSFLQDGEERMMTFGAIDLGNTRTIE